MVTTKTAVVSLTAETPDLEDAREKAVQQPEFFVGKIGTEMKTLENFILAKQDAALTCYHGVLQSVGVLLMRLMSVMPAPPVHTHSCSFL